MIKYGQMVKLTVEKRLYISDAFTRLNKEYKTKFKVKKELIKVWNNQEYEQKQFVIPAGTPGILVKFYVDHKWNVGTVMIPNPVSKKATSFAQIRVTGEEFTFDLTDEEKATIDMAHRRLVTKKVDDSFKAIQLIKHAKDYKEYKEEVPDAAPTV